MYELTPGPPSQPPHRCPWPGGLSWPQFPCPSSSGRPRKRWTDELEPGCSLTGLPLDLDSYLPQGMLRETAGAPRSLLSGDTRLLGVTGHTHLDNICSHREVCTHTYPAHATTHTHNPYIPGLKTPVHTQTLTHMIQTYMYPYASGLKFTCIHKL